jgi:1-acyl-sn-glycerol-3-phosphate acyltransferase
MRPRFTVFAFFSRGGPLPFFKATIRWLLRRSFLLLFRVRVRIRAESKEQLLRGGCLLSCNHVSFLDGVILAFASPFPLVFTSHTDFSRRNYFTRTGMNALVWLGFAGSVIPLDSSAPFSLRRIARGLQHNLNFVIFPEGGIGTGVTMQELPGKSWLVRCTNCTTVDAIISGAEKSRLFALRGEHLWPRITVQL